MTSTSLTVLYCWHVITLGASLNFSTSGIGNLVQLEEGAGVGS